MAFWNPDITDIPEIELQASEDSGLISCRWGSMAFKVTAFTGEPPDKCLIDLRWGLSSKTAFQIFKGTILRKSYEMRKISYEIYKPDLIGSVLDIGTDENGDACVIPMIFGEVRHMNPQRTETDTENRYYRPDFAGEIGTDWHAYDDGVRIDDNWTEQGDGTITRSVNIVGELTFSGTGNKTTLGDMSAWASERLGIEFVNKHDAADIDIDLVIGSQQLILDVLDKVAWYCNYRFYVKDDILTLIDTEQDNGSSLLGKFGFTPPIYEWADRIKSLTGIWITREGDGTGALTEQEHRIVLNGNHKLVGTEEEMPYIYNLSEEKVQARMEKILAYKQMPNIRISLPITRFPLPGEEIIFTDFKGGNAIGVVMHAEGVAMDYSNKMVNITGKGSLVFL